MLFFRSWSQRPSGALRRVPTGDSSPLTERSQLQLGEGAKRQDRRGAWPSITEQRRNPPQNVPQTLTLPPTVAQRTVAWLQGAPQGSFTGQTKKTNGNNGSNGNTLIPKPVRSECPWGGERTGTEVPPRVWGVAAGAGSGLAYCSSAAGMGKWTT